MNYYFSKRIKTTFDEAVERVEAGLKKENFSIVTNIDMDKKLKNTLNVNFRRYKIIGACNADYAYKALVEEDKIGVILPCNFIVQELESDLIEIAAVNPVASMSAIDNSKLMRLALEIQQKLKSIVATL